MSAGNIMYEFDRHVNVVVDIETLGTVAGSVILSIGACVAYTPFQKGVESRAVFNNPLTFYVKVNRNCPISTAALKQDSKTVKWWEEKPSAFAREAALGKGGVSLLNALEAFNRWLRSVKGSSPLLLWGKGPAFDNAHLEYAYDACGLRPAWTFRNDSCLRTVEKMTRHMVDPSDIKALHPSEREAHHAMYDAISEAKILELQFKAMQTLKKVLTDG